LASDAEFKKVAPQVAALLAKEKSELIASSGALFSLNGLNGMLIDLTM